MTIMIPTLLESGILAFFLFSEVLSMDKSLNKTHQVVKKSAKAEDFRCFN